MWHNVEAMRSAFIAWVHVRREALRIALVGVRRRLRIWSRPLLQGSGLPPVDKRDSEPGPAVCIGSPPIRRSGNHCAHGQSQSYTCDNSESMSLKVGPINAARMFFKDAKLPLVYIEAIANSIDWHATEIVITIRIQQATAIETLSITIEDNGIGIDPDGFGRFSELSNPRDKAHRGVGRLAFVANFNQVAVHSKTETQVRDFVFDNDFDAEKCVPQPNRTGTTGTIIELSNYSKGKLRDYGYIRPVTLKELILKEFYPRLHAIKVADLPMTINIHLEIDQADSKNNLSRSSAQIKVNELPELREVPFDASPAIMFEDMKLCYHIDAEYDGRLLVCGFSIDGRTYSNDILKDENLPMSSRGIFILSSPYFEGRSDDARERVDIDENTIKALKRRMAEEVDSLLKDNIPHIEQTNEVITTELNETFPHLGGYFPSECIGLVLREDMIQGATEKFVADQRKVLEAEHLTEEEFQKALELSARVLMEYVLYRNKTLEKLAGMTIGDEYDIHNLIVPRRKSHLNNKPTSIYTNNAWIMDDKFMTYSKILSEEELATLLLEISDKSLTEHTEGRPDIAIIFSKESMNQERVDVVIVELKKRDAKLKDQENVISQLRQRARRILKYYDEKVQRVWYYGITDISDEMLQVMDEESWTELYATGQIWYKEFEMRPIGETTGVTVPVGFFVMPYNTMLDDAKRRNSTFMNLLKSSISHGRPI